MLKKIKNQQVFQIIDGTCAITLPQGTYTLYISADGVNYTQKGEAIEGGDTLIMANAPIDLYCYLDGIEQGTELTVLL
jgi:hypothetical protein